MEGPISFWGYKEQESNLILREHDDDDDDDDDDDRHNETFHCEHTEHETQSWSDRHSTPQSERLIFPSNRNFSWKQINV